MLHSIAPISFAPTCTQIHAQSIIVLVECQIQNSQYNLYYISYSKSVKSQTENRK